MLIDTGQGDVRVSRSQAETVAHLLLGKRSEWRVETLFEPIDVAGSFHGYIGRYLRRESRGQENDEG
jgi:hypothetical protein